MLQHKGVDISPRGPVVVCTVRCVNTALWNGGQESNQGALRSLLELGVHCSGVQAELLSFWEEA
jgi:hypothetical protein